MLVTKLKHPVGEVPRKLEFSEDDGSCESSTLMRDRNPLISVGMPVYNGERYLEESIRSVLGQTLGDFELIICDNASSDGTEEICRSLAREDERIRYVRNPVNVGAAKNYNKLVSLARAPYFRWNNADDLLFPELHRCCYDLLVQSPDAVLAAGTTIIIDKHGVEIEAYNDDLELSHDKPSVRFEEFYRRVGLTNVIYGLMRTNSMRRTRLMGDGKVPAGDIRFMAELSLYGKFITLRQPLFYRRMHDTASSWDRGNGAVQSEFWTGKGAGFSYPLWRSMWRNVSAVTRAPIRLDDRVKLYRYLLKGIYLSKRRLISELLPQLVAAD